MNLLPVPKKIILQTILNNMKPNNFTNSKVTVKLRMKQMFSLLIKYDIVRIFKNTLTQKYICFLSN